MALRKRGAKDANASAGEGQVDEVSAKGGAFAELLVDPPKEKILTPVAQGLLDNVMKDLPLAKYEGSKLNCGMPWWLVGRIVGYDKTLRKKLLALLSALILPLEIPALWLLRKIPAKVMNTLMVAGFRAFVKVWSCLPHNIAHRGINKDLSIEAHAMSLVMWPARIFPMTLRRMRFGMANLDWYIPPDLAGVKQELVELPDRGVRGIWLHTAPKDVEDPPVFFWVFGGAFFAGDIEGNRGYAARYARQLGADAFVVDYRLLPEHTIAEAFRDGTRAYEYVLSRKSPEKIMVAGISAGAGLLINALQCARSKDPAVRKWAFHGSDPTPQPAGAMLIGPYVDFTIPTTGDAALAKNSATDFIVTQRVLEMAAPLLMKGEGTQERLRGLSPLYKDLSGLCPVHVNYALREATTDMCDQLVAKLKAAGNEVDTFTTPYLGHVFQVFLSFLPEAQEAEKAAVSWMRKHLK